MKNKAKCKPVSFCEARDSAWDDFSKKYGLSSDVHWEIAFIFGFAAANRWHVKRRKAARKSK